MAIPLIPFVASAFSWLFRGIVVKFLVFTAVFALVSFLVPYAVSYLGNFTDTFMVGYALYSLDEEIWYVIRFFDLEDGLPLIFSAYVSRFLIRRLPIIG